MMVLYFLVLFSVGILRPIRNTLALDGLAQSQFYKVYLVSSVVVLFAPAYNLLADRIRWKILIPATAGLFALNLLLFRLVYTEGSTAFGVIFYGWYDLFAAALVTQFFMAVQLFFNARDAKRAIPLVIAAGSLGATLGGFTTGFLAQTMGTPNLMLLAAIFIGAFAVGLPLVWTDHREEEGARRPKASTLPSLGDVPREVTRIFSNRQVRLIATLVLITIVVKTMVDYQYNEAVAAYAGDRDAIARFQGFVFGATQWLPILVLLPLGPLLKRWGIGLAVLALPVVMLGGTLALAAAFSVWTAVVAKAADTTFRYSSERTAREILYVPVPTELKLKAKAYVDMGIEKGIGKAFSAVLIFVFLTMMDYRQVAWIAVGVCVLWIGLGLSVKREYVRTLARSIRGRFASLETGYATLTERSTLALVEEALRSPETMQVSFALHLVEEADRVDAEVLADELDLLLDHASPDIRRRVLDLLTRFPGLVPLDRVRPHLGDPSLALREAAVRALCAGSPERVDDVLEELLSGACGPARMAALSCLVRGEMPVEGRSRLGSRHVQRLRESGSDRREELALALGLLEEEARAAGILEGLLDDPEPRVARAALRSAGAVGSESLHPRVVRALGDPELREAARDALASAGLEVVDLLEATLKDRRESLPVRRGVPGALARIGGQASVEALLRALRDPDLDRVASFRTLKALNRIRARGDGDVAFDPTPVLAAARREVEAAGRHSVHLATLERVGASGPGIDLLRQAIGEAWEERREAVFRCLGLVYPAEGMYDCYMAVTAGGQLARANALEWLDHTLGNPLFTRVGPILRGAGAHEPAPGERLPTLSAVLRELASGPDAWHTALAVWNLNRPRERDDPPEGDEQRMDLIEKVFLLQEVDLFQGAKSSHLALLASVAEEIEAADGEVLVRKGEPGTALFILVRGAVELTGMGERVLVAREHTPFGTWALIDADPSLVGAVAVEPSRLLRITRDDFQGLLADHAEFAVGMLQGLARRVRQLVA